ncbi:MAG: peroxiredoxin [Verrucomicrobia bacterium]|nr:MAG: peroxiredoxin [Verrucomicrobiota bacterium]
MKLPQLLLLALGLGLTAPLAGAELDPALIYQPGHLKPIDSRLKVRIGQPAPDFTLPAIDGRRIRLSDFRGRKNVVLSFVPAAFTPVCSAQWPGYNLALDLFEEQDAVLLGITTDNLPTLHAWTRLMGGVRFPVLSDFWPHGAVADRYGVLRSDGTAERALFVIDKQGIIRWIDVHDINQRPPLDDLLAALDRINRPAPAKR